MINVQPFHVLGKRLYLKMQWSPFSQTQWLSRSLQKEQWSGFVREIYCSSLTEIADTVRHTVPCLTETPRVFLFWLIDQIYSLESNLVDCNWPMLHLKGVKAHSSSNSWVSLSLCSVHRLLYLAFEVKRTLISCRTMILSWANTDYLTPQCF